VFKDGGTTRVPQQQQVIDQRRRSFADELAALREKALSELEARGFAVRGKTPGQIRKALKVRPRKKDGKER
jgi:hypothetical protein